MSTIDQAQIDALKKKIADKAAKLPDRSDDLVGYWDPNQLPINCKPRDVKLFDSKLDPSKSSALITVLALEPTVCDPASKEKKDQFICKAGDLIGVWYKPGMRAIASCAGVECTITLTGELKPMKVGNDMKVYEVKAADGGTRIPITLDARDKSKPHMIDGKLRGATPFDVLRSAAAAGPGGADADDIPF